ncbi:ROK family protein [Kitasatospora sp. NPDC048365]|uniref:ROK family protein n=1 Tax=Kitasatospora sp. NPDC048365 TaxID=3364050 RepID=UPI00370FA988
MTGPVTVAALDVGGTSIKASILDAYGAVLHRESVVTGARDGRDAVTENVLALARRLVDGFGCAAVGIALPGTVDEAAGTVVRSACLDWRDVPVRRWVEDELDVPVAIGQAVRAGALAEAGLGAGRGCPSFLFVSVGTGIAGAVVLDGRAEQGAGGGAGGIGHLVVRPGGPECACGGRGCLESVASAAAVAGRYRAAGGAAPGGPVSAQEVQWRARAGDALAEAVWRDAVAALADGLAAAVTVLDPHCVIVGGGLSRAGAALFAPLRRAFADRLAFRSAPRLVAAGLGDRAGSLGAGLLALDLLGHPLEALDPVSAAGGLG